MSQQNVAVAEAVRPEAQAPPPEAFLIQMAFGALMTQALYVAAKLGVADLLKGGPRAVAELAAETNTHERSLYRVLRSLASAGVFREVEPKVFATPLYSTFIPATAQCSLCSVTAACIAWRSPPSDASIPSSGPRAGSSCSIDIGPS